MLGIMIEQNNEDIKIDWWLLILAPIILPILIGIALGKLKK